MTSCRAVGRKNVVRPLLLAASLFFATPVLPQTGVLLGLEIRDGSFDPTGSLLDPKYQTLWIAPDGNGQLKVRATLAELVVPRRDGFWHVGVRQICEFANNNEDLRQVVWAAPVAQAATIEQTTPCTPRKPEDYAGTYGRSEEDKSKISQCGIDRANIAYLSPELVSVKNYSTRSEDCEPRGGHYTQDYRVRKFDSDKPLRFDEVLGEKAGDAYYMALPKQAKNDGGEECGGPDQNDQTGWRIAHSRGTWRPYLNQSLGNFGCSVDAAVPVKIPAVLTGDPSLAPDWKLLLARIGGIEDAFVSPRGDLLIAVVRSELRFYEASAGIPGRVLLTLPAHTIVMVQWAQGEHVRDWTTEIDKISKRAFPEPVMHVKHSPK